MGLYLSYDPKTTLKWRFLHVNAKILLYIRDFDMAVIT